MRISPISSFWSKNRVSTTNNYVQNPVINSSQSNDVFIKSSAQTSDAPLYPPRTISFMGYNIHIIDGGKHLKEMAQFAKIKTKDVKIKVHAAESTDDWDLNKPLKNILEQLKEMNKFGYTDENSYVAIPVKITVPLQNLAEQYKRVMGYYLHLKPHSTQTCKNKIMDFLKILYEDPEKHKKYIRYMDPKNQGMEYAYGIIQEINKLKCKKVYVPAEHPNLETLNWLAGERGEKADLTNYLATGYDKDGKVNNMYNYIKGRDWYDLNLLALSKAEVVNLKKADGISDHLYSAYDTTVNDGARGVYNLSPVRENGNLVGYSYNDTVTNEFPYEEFPYNEKVKDLAKFVGRYVDDVVADDATTFAFKNALETHEDTSRFSNKLFPVWKLFGENQLYKGDFVDSNLEHYFRRNSNYEIIYPPADCESNGKPSVMGMWGSDYSMLNAIKRDIAQLQFADQVTKGTNLKLSSLARDSFESAKIAEKNNDLHRAENLLSEVIKFNNMEGFNRNLDFHIMPYKHMGDVKLKLGDYDGANWHFNFYVNNLSKNFLDQYPRDGYLNTTDIRAQIADGFLQLAEIAKRRSEMYPEMECRRASGEVRYLSRIGLKVLERRADNDINIGDLFE